MATSPDWSKLSFGLEHTGPVRSVCKFDPTGAAFAGVLHLQSQLRRMFDDRQRPT